MSKPEPKGRGDDPYGRPVGDGPPLSEGELLSGYRGLSEDTGVLFGPAPELVAALEDALGQLAVIRAELTTVRELVELLVSWAGIDPEAHRAEP